MNRALCIILILSALAISSFSFSAYRYVRTVSDKIETENKLQNTSLLFLSDFQEMKHEETDFKDSGTLNILKEKYKGYSILIEDISTGINKETFPENIIGNEKINHILEQKSCRTSTYGWLNASRPNAKTLKKITDSYKSSAFPLANYMPLVNILYLEKESLEAILEADGISDSARKADELYYKLNEAPVTKSEIAKILNIPLNHKIFGVIGTKTTFWRAVLSLRNMKNEIILAAIPKKEEPEKIEKYIVIKERFFNEY